MRTVVWLPLTIDGYVIPATIKSVDTSVNNNSVLRLNHYDVIASRSKILFAAWQSHLQKLIWDKTQTDTWIEQLDTHESNPAGQFMPLNPCDCIYLNTDGGDNAHWILKNKIAAAAVQWELCGTNLRENIANLPVSCYNGNNDRSIWVLFVQHPQEQCQLLSSGFTASFTLLLRVLYTKTPSQSGHYPLTKPLSYFFVYIGSSWWWLVHQIQNHFCELDHKDFHGWEWPQDRRSMKATRAALVLEWAENHCLTGSFPRADYRELCEILAVVLGGEIRITFKVIHYEMEQVHHYQWPMDMELIKLFSTLTKTAWCCGDGAALARLRSLPTCSI